MLSQAHIQQRLSLTPEQKTKLKWTAGGFFTGVLLVYGLTSLGEECASSFSLSIDELFKFIQKNIRYIAPSSAVSGFVGGLLGYLKGNANVHETALLDNELKMPFNIQTLYNQDVQEIGSAEIYSPLPKGLGDKSQDSDEEIEADSSFMQSFSVQPVLEAAEQSEPPSPRRR